ncbi:MAG: hypothetical protein ACLPUT_06315 [Solirubrobacteraceae bacterium]
MADRESDEEIDVTLAALAASELGRASEALWDEQLERITTENPEPGPATGRRWDRPCTRGHDGGLDDHRRRGRWHVQHTGTLLGVEVREVGERLQHEVRLGCDVATVR